MLPAGMEKSDCVSSGIPAPTSTRDNARSLLQRLHATPAKLIPLALNRLVAGHSQQSASLPSAGPDSHPGRGMPQSCLSDSRGLSARDVVIVRHVEAPSTSPASASPTAPSPDGFTTLHDWQTQMAALHTMRGGRVALVYAPGTRTFSLTAFVRQLELLARGNVVPQTAAGTDDTTAAGEVPLERTVAGQQAQVLAALKRLTVVACEDVQDIHVFCSLFEFPDAPQNVNATSSSPARLIVPLVFCFGFGGRGGYVFHLERAAGKEVPLRHWLLCELRRRLRCALVILETPAATYGNALFPTRPESTRHFSESSAMPQKRAREESGAGTVLDPLQSDVVMRFTNPHRHIEAGREARTRSGDTTSTKMVSGMGTRHAVAPNPALPSSREPDTRTAASAVATDGHHFPAAELTDSQFFCLSLLSTGVVLQKVRLSDATLNNAMNRSAASSGAPDGASGLRLDTPTRCAVEDHVFVSVNTGHYWEAL